jgi:hypothetical protein
MLADTVGGGRDDCSSIAIEEARSWSFAEGVRGFINWIQVTVRDQSTRQAGFRT